VLGCFFAKPVRLLSRHLDLPVRGFPYLMGGALAE
jgi:hypothetical protein